jgi:hypothetical protein
MVKPAKRQQLVHRLDLRGAHGTINIRKDLERDDRAGLETRMNGVVVGVAAVARCG